MNQLSLRNKQSFQEFMKFMYLNRKMSACNQLDSETLGFNRLSYAQKSPWTTERPFQVQPFDLLQFCIST
jgi:hypothetical protein